MSFREKWQGGWAAAFGLLAPAATALTLYEVVQLWPKLTADSAASSTVDFGFGVQWTLDQEQAFLVLASLGGVLGGLVYTMGIYARRRSRGKFKPEDANWYWVRSVVAAALSVGVYVLMRAGLFLLGGSNADSGENRSPYAVLGVSIVVGLFTDKVLTKLREIAGNFFASDSERDDEDGATSSRRSIVEWSPKQLVPKLAGQELVLTVTPGDEPVVLRVGGVPVTPLVDTATPSTLKVKLSDDAVTAGSSVVVELDHGDGSVQTVNIPLVTAAEVR